MPVIVTTPHRPFDRLWQPGHPFRPRRSNGRRWTMALLLIFMSGFISSYWYLTDPQRIKQMSQAYLSELTGGPVEVGSASLKIFEGLELHNVVMKVDNSNAPDSVLLTTDAIVIQYNPSSLLKGKLQATRIIATSARVKLVEDSAAGRWNYQRLKPRHEASAKRPSSESTIPVLPEVVLRDAMVEYSEISKGQRVVRGAMGMGGRAFPSANGERIIFEVQSRGVAQGVGPFAGGEVTLKTGQITARLSGLTFGKDIEAMLPHQVREFWDAHKVEGSLDIPEFTYMPPAPGHRATFRVRTQLKEVQLIIRARELESSGAGETAATRPDSNFFDRAFTAAGQGAKAVKDLHLLPEQPPMHVDDVSGTFLFDENGIGIDKVVGTLAGATVEINGKIDGYSPDAAVKMRIETPQEIRLPSSAEFLASLPSPARVAFLMLHPQGTGSLWIDVQRDASGKPRVVGELHVTDGAFDTVFFPYPARGAVGTIAFFPDKQRPFERVELRHLHAFGLIGGPNEHNEIEADGWLSGDDPDAGCWLHFASPHVVAEPELFAAMPPPVRRVMTIFRGPGHEQYLRGTAGFDCVVDVPPGKGKVHPIVAVDLDLADGAGALTAFPYPMEHLRGVVNIRDGYVALHDINLTHGKAAVNVNGRVSWPPNVPDDVPVIATPDVHLAAQNVPIDDELLNVLPADARHWIQAMGVNGTLDVDGPIILQPTASDPGAIGFHLGIDLRDAKVRPLNHDFAIDKAGGKLTVHTDHVDVAELHGQRGDSELHGSGVVDWSGAEPRVTMNGAAKNLKLDEPLRQLLPEPAQRGWAAVDPHGSVDAGIYFDGVVPRSSDTGPTTAPASLPIQAHNFKLTLQPTELSVTAEAVPYRLDHCTGSITIDPNTIVITKFGGQHGKGAVEVTGKGLTSSAGDWDLSMKSHDLAVDDDLTRAIPPALRQLVSDLKLKGNLNLDLKSMKYRGDHRPDGEPDIDFNGKLHTSAAKLDVGMPLVDMTGDLNFAAAVRAGKVAAFHGDIALDSVSFADRPVNEFKASLDLPANSDTVEIAGIQGQIAGGDIAGDVKLRFPDQGPSSYSMDFAIKNADLREVAKQVAPKGQQVRGQMSASLALQGEWSDPKSRRGRGDVLVSGKEMYQIPLMLGLMEVTNLSLPPSSPFNEGTARYLVEGPRVTFEQIQMRSNQMVMSGNGWLDFDSKKVRMNFTTENPQLPQLPIIGDLVAGAKQELLQIQVRGTVQNPKVSAASLHTFTTTVDEVFSGGEK